MCGGGGGACQPVLNQDPRNENFFPFRGGLLYRPRWDDGIEVNWKKAWENAPTINNPRIKLALAWWGRMKSEWWWMTLRHVGWAAQRSPSLGCVSIQGQSVYLGWVPSALATKLDTAGVLSALETLYTLTRNWCFCEETEFLVISCCNTAITLRRVDEKSKTSGFQLWFMSQGAWLCDKLEITKLCGERFMVNMIKAILSHQDRRRGEESFKLYFNL